MDSIVVESTGRVIVNHIVRAWCRLPYDGHPHGCPNFGKKPTCPPRIGLVDNIADLSRESYLIAIRFDLDEHQRKMKTRHPEWTAKQCRNLLYWQGKVRKRLVEEVIVFLDEHKGMRSTLIPEAMGVHVLKTARGLGIPVKIVPARYVYKIALIYYPKEKKKEV